MWKTLAAVLLLAVGVRAALPERGFTVTVLDVGQGDAVLVQCGTAQVLVDGGPDGTVLSGLGRRMPFFDRRIDAVVLTHPHADHYLGLIPVAARYRVGAVYGPGLIADEPEYAAFLAAAGEPVPLVAGDRIAVGDCGSLEVVWADPKPRTGNPNDASVVLRVAAHGAVPGAAVLLTGDATEVVERALLADPARVPLLRADALKAGHHGSRTSSSAAFLAAVAPRYAAISSGEKNSYGHPAKAALERLQSVGAQVFRTDTGGDVRFALTRDGVSVKK